MEITKEDFSTIEDLPLGFEINDKLRGYLQTVQTEWLPGIIGSTKIASLEAAILSGTVTLEEQKYIDLIKPFLVNAAWRDWVRFGHIQNTAAGLTQFTGGEGSLISKEDRDQLATYYYNRANRLAGRLGALYESEKTNRSCSPGKRITSRPSVIILQGKNKGERF